MSKLRLDYKRCEAHVLDEKVCLSAKESHLLEYFIRNKEQVLTREQIFNKIWGNESSTEISAVELYVFYLRKKIDLKKSNVVLETVRGVGYCLKEATDE